MSRKQELPIILASSSPRRYELLQQAGIKPAVCTIDIDETQHPEELPQAYISRMVAQKADAALSQLRHETPCILITADTIGVLPESDVALQKPASFAAAVDMWQQMSDSIHEVWTAVQVTLVNGEATVVCHEQLLEVTEVKFIALSSERMQRYWQSGEPLDKAGGYAIQSGAAAWVEWIYGSYSNVVGLPLAQTIQAIERASSHFCGSGVS